MLGDSADCYLRLLLEHLPSTTEASPIFQHNSAACEATKFTGVGLPGCPRTEVRGGKSGQTPPFPASRQDYLTTPGRQISPAQAGVKSQGLHESARATFYFSPLTFYRSTSCKKKKSKSPRRCRGQLVPSIVGFGIHRAQLVRDLLIISRYGIFRGSGIAHLTLLV